jgi:hypothetical protein
MIHAYIYAAIGIVWTVAGITSDEGSIEKWGELHPRRSLLRPREHHHQPLRDAGAVMSLELRWKLGDDPRTVVITSGQAHVGQLVGALVAAGAVEVSVKERP